jgi:hypothetical protein
MKPKTEKEFWDQAHSNWILAQGLESDFTELLSLPQLPIQKEPALPSVPQNNTSRPKSVKSDP